MTDLETRAREGARITSLPVVLSLAPVPGERRTPIAVAEVQLGAATLRYGISGLKRGRFEVRPPMGPDGRGGVELPPAIAAIVASAIHDAVEASPAIRAHLLRRSG